MYPSRYVRIAGERTALGGTTALRTSETDFVTEEQSLTTTRPMLQGRGRSIRHRARRPWVIVRTVEREKPTPFVPKPFPEIVETTKIPWILIMLGGILLVLVVK